jgi:hypothetical protein
MVRLGRRSGSLARGARLSLPRGQPRRRDRCRRRAGLHDELARRLAVPVSVSPCGTRSRRRTSRNVRLACEVPASGPRRRSVAGANRESVACKHRSSSPTGIGLVARVGHRQPREQHRRSVPAPARTQVSRHEPQRVSQVAGTATLRPTWFARLCLRRSLASQRAKTGRVGLRLAPQVIVRHQRARCPFHEHEGGLPDALETT